MYYVCKFSKSRISTTIHDMLFLSYYQHTKWISVHWFDKLGRYTHDSGKEVQ
jgi:hypothetical protein